MASPFSARRHGQSGIEVTELFPHVASCIDQICVIRSMYTDNPNHEPSLLMMNSGNMQPIRPSLGSWLTFGLGTENQNLPGFVVLCPGKPVVVRSCRAIVSCPASTRGHISIIRRSIRTGSFATSPIATCHLSSSDPSLTFFKH